MPALYALAQQPALHDVQAALREGEAIFAYPDDTYIVAAPERVRELYECYRAALWAHARVEISIGKTRIWNAVGRGTAGCRRAAARRGRYRVGRGLVVPASPARPHRSRCPHRQ